MLDLIERKWTVHIVADAVGSQREIDRNTAIERLKQSGALMTTTESILFQLMGTADDPAFKIISGYAKEPRPSTSNL